MANTFPLKFYKFSPNLYYINFILYIQLFLGICRRSVPGLTIDTKIHVHSSPRLALISMDFASTDSTNL